jgi:hypothetical protein
MNELRLKARQDWSAPGFGLIDEPGCRYAGSVERLNEESKE